LAPGSPLIDAGAPTPEASKDKAGNVRPFGTNPDIGAYEFR
jgi:hypothetical protein